MYSSTRRDFSISTDGSFSETVRQMTVKLTTRRVGKYNYLLAKGIVESSRACMVLGLNLNPLFIFILIQGDSGSPVYCFVDGKRVLVGTVAHIGSFGKTSSNSPAEHISFCKQFEYAFISDWRETSGRVIEILEKYGYLEELEEGQEMCFGSGRI
uniref:Peptidase S1 domain-containing protein n=1 Tax=Caenorhabditis japonica TaxID=281687 RepID=A0A8R1HXY8_CAEJA